MQRTFRVVAGSVVAVVVLAPFLAIWLGRSQLHDAGVERRATLVGADRPRRIMTFFPHPGDEVSVAGTLAGRAMEQLYEAHAGQPGFTVERLYQVTLSPKQVAVARGISPIFRKRYPTAPGAGLLAPDFSVHTQPHFAQVKGVVAAHASQRWVLGQFLPLHDRVPAPVYSRIFDREYFREVPRQGAAETTGIRPARGNAN